MWLSRAQGARYLGSDTAFRMPVWAAEGLDPAGTYLHEQIVMAFSTYCKRQNPQIDLLAQLQNAKEHWDMPKRLFMAWVNLHSHPNEPLPDNWYDYGARIIMDNEGKCHVLPFWRVEMITDHSVYEVKVFGDFDDGAATVLNYARSSQREGTTEEITIRGWQTHVFFDANDHEIEEPFSGLELLERIFDRGTWGRFRLPFDKSAIREQPLKIMDSVWKDLIHILGNAAHWTGQQLPDIFLEEKEPKHPTHTDNSADFNDNAPKTSGLRQRRQSY